MTTVTPATVAQAVRDRVDATIGYVRSFFDEPLRTRKGSMARACAPAALCAAYNTARWTFAFAMANPKETGTIAVLAGIPAVFATGVVLHLLVRTRADQGSEPDNAPTLIPTPQQTTTTVTTTAGETPL